MQTVDVGEVVPVTTTWWDLDGNAAEPSAIALTITKPDGTELSYTKADLTQGATTDVWVRAVTVDQDGAWAVHADGVVAGEHVIQDSMFLVGAETASGPCQPWCSWEDVDECGKAPDVEPSVRERAIDQASSILFDLSGRVYSGLCTVSRSLCFACYTCRPHVCSCDPFPGVDLGGGRVPVWAVREVIVEGVTLDPTTYGLRGRRWLVRYDRGWPSGWHTIDPSAFRATWVQGNAIPRGATLAAAEFSAEIAKACAGDSSCRLPKRFTNIQREGVTFTVVDSMKMIAEGRTGLPMVDLWLVSDQKGRTPGPRGFHPAAHSLRRLP